MKKYCAVFFQAFITLSVPVLSACGGNEVETSAGQSPALGPTPTSIPAPTPIPTSAPTPTPTPPPSVSTYSVGGTLSGLGSGKSVALQNNGNGLSLSANGAFVFPAKLNGGADYAVTVTTQPAGQICAVTNGSGKVGTTHVSNINVACIDNGAGTSRTAIGPQPFVATPLAQGTLFAKPNGTGGTCSSAAPCDVWTAAGQAKGGDVVFLRGGVYAVSKNLSFGTQASAAAPVIFESYPGELAILDGSQHAKGAQIYIRVTGKFIHLRGIEIRNMPRQGLWIGGPIGTDNLIDGVHVHHSVLSGIHVFSDYNKFPYGAEGSRNTIRHCTVHDNSGAGLLAGEFANGGNSDGISVSSGADNRIENCLVYKNSDDGIDSWRSTGTYIGYNIVHSQGIAEGNGNGIKAGGLPPSYGTVVENNLAYSNKAFGLDFNSGVAVKFLNNTSWNNKSGYSLGADTVASKNIAAETSSKSGTGVATNNSWQRTGSVAFVSTDPASAQFLFPTAHGGFADIGALIKTPSTVGPLPDVVITNLSYANGLFTVTVKNQGTAPTPANIAVGVGFTVEGSFKTWTSINGPLAADASMTFSTQAGGNVISQGGPYLIPKGTYIINAVVDDVDRFQESNEVNNQRSLSVTVK